MSDKTVLLNVHEIYEIPTMKSLYGYLSSSDLDANVNIFLNPSMRNNYITPFFEGIPLMEYTPSVDLVVNDFSDLAPSCIGLNNLEIDRSLLRNTISPLTKREKTDLRQKYNIPLERKVVTIDYECAHLYVGHVNEIIEALHEDAHLYVLGSWHDFKYYKIQDKFLDGEQKVHLVRKDREKIRDYYAMADLAINSNHVGSSYGPDATFDFVNATEGGPLFMSECKPGLFGFKELVEMGAIRMFPYRKGQSPKLEEGSHTEQYFKGGGMKNMFAGAYRDVSVYDLALDAKEFLQSCEGNEEHVRNRAKHIIKTRSKYLPVILFQIKKRLGQEKNADASDLNVKENTWVTRLVHPDTVWKRGAETERPLYDPRLPQCTNYGINQDVFIEISQKRKGISRKELIEAGYDVELPEFRSNVDVIGSYIRRKEDQEAKNKREYEEWKQMEKERDQKLREIASQGKQVWHEYRRAHPQGGGCCFLTTACVDFHSLPDDCHELETMRLFRDNVLLKTKKGKELVEEYYSIAPPIIKKLNQNPSKKKIYSGMFETIKKIVGLIEKGEYSKATRKYKKMVLSLNQY